MAREIFYKGSLRLAEQTVAIEAAINFPSATFGLSPDVISPWTIAITNGLRDLGRLVGYEGTGEMITSMHQLKPDPSAKRAIEITVFRVDDPLRENKLDAAIFGAFERWLLKRGWRGNCIKKLKFTDIDLVVPIRKFWLGMGFELTLTEVGQWEEHVVKRWR
ncbi:MAG TPA: hypothetical protein VGK87_10445 [Anaerolineae bacterium]|jgi:hypothetical protein